MRLLLVPSKKKGMPIPHIYICNAIFCVCNSFSFTLYMAQGPLHNLVVWSGDLVQVVTWSIYYTLSFLHICVVFETLRLCSLTIHFFKKMIDDIQQRLRKKIKCDSAWVLLLSLPWRYKCLPEEHFLSIMC